MKRYFSLILAIAATVSAQIVPSTGNVRGPTSATDNAVARYDGTTGKLIQNSGVTIDDSGNLTVSGTGTSSFSGDLTFATSKGIYSAVQNGRLYLSGDSAGAGAFLTLTGSSFSNPNNIRIDANTGTISNLANTKNSTWDINQNWAIAGNLTVSGFDSTYYNANAALIGNATYNPKLALASSTGYTWTARTNDVGGAGEFIVRYEEGSKDFLTIDRNGNTVVNSAAIATNATNGFLYVPSCAGTPTGTPTTYTGRVPIVVDTTNNKLYFYSGGQWRDAGP